jgi:NAD(P)-dependent dehydrogenase (short-subunit alcohol dehydrogenase family)
VLVSENPFLFVISALLNPIYNCPIIQGGFMPSSMQGKTVLVTGATNGIGYVAARELARKGAQTVLVSRSAEKCSQSVESIKKETGNPQVEFIVADLSTNAGVQETAHEFKKRHTRLDVLLNNAGAMFMSRQVSKDGIEMTIALNHLNYFHLTILLLDVLKATGSSRIVNVSSDAHRGGKINFDDIQLEKGYSGMKAYSQSKLANVLFTYELARKLEGTKVTANALHPGFVDTGFGKNNGGLIKFGMSLLKPIQRKPDVGAQTSIYLASSPEVEGVSGKYFADSKAVESDPASYDRGTAEKLWNISFEMMA